MFKNKALLINRKWNTGLYDNIRDSWYAPSDLLKSFKSVKEVVLCDTTSSSGDWAGFFVQELNKTKYVIPFTQSNNYPYKGYSVYTTDVGITFKGEWDIDDLTKYFCENFC